MYVCMYVCHRHQITLTVSQNVPTNHTNEVISGNEFKMSTPASTRDYFHMVAQLINRSSQLYPVQSQTKFASSVFPGR